MAEKKEEIVLNSDDEDQYGLPACGSSGDPAHKLKVFETKKEDKCSKSLKKSVEGGDCKSCDCDCKDCSCEKKDKEEKKVDESELGEEKKGKKICYKCKEQESQYKYRQDFACKKCFESNIDHKFKANLKLKINLGRNEKFLVCVSGGANSLALAQLVSNALHNTMGKKMFFEAELFYIDEDVLYKKEKQAENLEKINKMSELLKIKLTIAKLTDIYKDIENEEERENKLLNLLKQFKAIASCQEDLVSFFKTQLYLEYAYRNNFDKVLLGNCGQRLASKIFTLFTKGRAASSDNEIQFIDNVSYDILGRFFDLHDEDNKVYSKITLGIGRPMKDYLNKEIMNYLHCMGILNLLTERPFYLCEQEKSNLKLPGYGNLDRIMEKFIDNIQENFVSTTHTILHTSEKIIKKFEPQKGLLQRCPLCFQFRDKISNVLEIETFDSNLTHSLEGEQNDGVRTQETLKLKYLETDKIKNRDMRELVLCFGCRRILQSQVKDEVKIFESDLLPNQIVKRASHIAQNTDILKLF
ncbi:hypothetical protein ABPG72_011494 [Tetrahymena utriculariae]